MAARDGRVTCSPAYCKKPLIEENGVACAFLTPHRDVNEGQLSDHSSMFLTSWRCSRDISSHRSTPHVYAPLVFVGCLPTYEV